MMNTRLLQSIKFRALTLSLVSLLVFAACLWMMIDSYRQQLDFYDFFSGKQQSAEQELNQLFSEFGINHIQIYDVLRQSKQFGDEAGLYAMSHAKLEELKDTLDKLNAFEQQYARHYPENIRSRLNRLIVDMQEYNRSSVVAIMQSSVNPDYAYKIMTDSGQYFIDISNNFTKLQRDMQSYTRMHLETFNDRNRNKLISFTMMALIAIFTIIVLSLLFVRFLSMQLNSIHTTLSAMTDGNSDLRCDIKSRNEISDIAEEVNQLADKIDYEKAVGDAKASFMANMSHEIRTPMNGIIGVSEMLQHANDPKKIAQYSQLIHGSAHSLLTIINDILDFSKIEAGELSIRPAAFNLKTITTELTALFQTQAQAKSIAVNLHYGDDVANEFIGDKDRIRQILNNLINNALKFTETGNVSIKVRRYADATSKRADKNNGAERIQISVIDTGVGIKEKDFNNIFRDFFQVDHSQTRSFGGTGLGLAISQRLAMLMGGEIKVSSIYGKGSSFSLVLPLMRVDQSEVMVQEVSRKDLPQYHKSILLAEDNAVNQLVTQSMLDKLAVKVDIANNGEVCVQQFKLHDYDLILMDVHMPVKDGLEAAKEIRQLEAAQNHAYTPIVALTASALETDRRRCLEAGMDDVLTKPLGFASLIEQLDTYL